MFTIFYWDQKFGAPGSSKPEKNIYRIPYGIFRRNPPLYVSITVLNSKKIIFLKVFLGFPLDKKK